VRVRLYLDPEQPARSAQGGGPLGHLLRTHGVEARIKAANRDMMHLKAYQIDGRFLRSGSANFSFSGERRQDNDIVVVESRDAAGAFTAQFERLWARADNDRVRP
jgi:phosphatidylserine/phosphatidylglycerophosphate/cardiolipin synthase-like enzyme